MDEDPRDLEEVVEEKQNPPNQPLPLRRSPRKTKSNTQSKKLVCRVQRKVATSKRVKRSTKQPSQTEAGPSNAISSQTEAGTSNAISSQTEAGTSNAQTVP